MNRSTPILSETSSILLDSSVILWLSHKNVEDPICSDVNERFRISALTTDEFLITQDTLHEIESVVSGLKKKRTSNRRINTLEIDEKNIHLHLLDYERVRIFDPSSKLDIDDHESQIIDNLNKLNMIKPYQTEKAAFHDAKLLLTSESLKIPIFTLDARLMYLTPIPEIEFYLPFDFDIDALKQMPIDELMDLASPLRSIYKTAFNSIKNYKKKVVNQEEILKEYEKEVEELKSSEKAWRETAKPDAKKAILWTIAECITGLFPFPLPSSPLSYFIDIRKYKKMSSKKKQYEDNQALSADAKKPRG
jgi:hypothetical protein